MITNEIMRSKYFLRFFDLQFDSFENKAVLLCISKKSNLLEYSTPKRLT